MRRLCIAFVLIGLGCGADTPGLTGTEGSSSSGSSSETSDPLTMTGMMSTAADPSADGGSTQGVDDDPSASGPSTTSGVVDDTTAGEASASAGTTDETTTGVSTSGGSTGGDGCGNGSIDLGEQCDGNNLQGFDCAGLGLGTGDLSCDAVTCTFDTSMCVMDPGGTSG